MRLSVRPGAKITRSLGFSRAVESAPDATTSVALCRTFNPISSQSDSRVLCPLRRKENSSQGSRRRLRVRLRRRLGHGALSASRFGNVNPIPFRGTALARPTGGTTAPSRRSSPFSQDRLTHVQLLFTWNPSPLQSSKFSFEYLLLPPRSAPAAASPRLAPEAARPPPRPPTRRVTPLDSTAGYGYDT